MNSSGGGQQQQQPSIASFAPGASAIETGSSTTLTATFSNGTGVITAAGGFSQNVTSGTAITVSPTTSTTYTLTVTGASGTSPVAQNTTVTVDPVPAIASFSAAASTIEATTSTTLTADFTGGTGIITPGNISVTSGTAVTVSPAATTTYTLNVTPPVGTIDATPQSATVTVDPVPTVTSFTVASNSANSGGNIQFTAVFANGTGAISGPGIASTPVTSGQQVTVTAPTVTSQATETYTLTVSPPVGTIDATQTVNVSVSPSSAAITSFTANPTSVESGSSTTLDGVFSGGTAVITGPGGFSQSVTSGEELPVTPPAVTAETSDTYTLTVTPTGGGTAVTQTVAVTVYPQPVITSFTAATNPLVAGNTTTLTAVFSNGTAAISPGANGASGSFSDVSSNTPVTVSPQQTATYTLTVTPPVGAAITQTLTLNVDPSVSVCTTPSCSDPEISDQLLGMNLAMWYDDIANAGSIVSAFKTAGITAVRWPGGSDSDIYHWATNSGCSGLYSAPDNTFANFESDIVQAGSLDLAVTADYGTNTSCDGPGEPSEAASWAAAAVNDGTPIHYMTVGNEVYGASWEVDEHGSSSAHNPTVYACEMNACTNLPSNLSTGLTNNGSPGFYQAIKTAVEGAGGTANTTLVGVVVCGGTCPDPSADWDQTVLANAAGSYDFVEYHYYPQNPGGENDTTLLQNGPVNFTANINTIKSELSTAGQSGKPIYVGEIGSVSSNPGKQSWSITQGLYAGEVLGEAMNDGVARLTWWIGFGNCNGSSGNMSASLYGWQDFGAYNVFSDGATDSPPDQCDGDNIPIGTMSPTAQAFNLFQNVAVAGEFPQTTTVVDGAGYTRAYTATTASGGYALMLFNLNETAAENVSVSIGSMSSATDVKMTTYDKEIYDQTDPTCQTDAGCSYNSSLTYGIWAPPVTTDLGAQSAMPMTITLQPWSMNVVIVTP